MEYMGDVITYAFGSVELDDLERRARGLRNEVKWDYHGHRYIVDHGNHKTLNTMIAGKVNVCMIDLDV